MYTLNDKHLENLVTIDRNFNYVFAPISYQNNRTIKSIQNVEETSTTGTISIEYQLSNFINWVLRVTANGEYSGDAAIELLDQAWILQKLLWRLRESKIF
jgi:hypothetical protein